MILNYEAYHKTIEDQERRKSEIEMLKEQYKKDMDETKQKITEEMKKQLAQLIHKINPEILREVLNI